MNLRPALRLFSRPYALLMQKRRDWYANGRLRQYIPSRPCISVGNIAWGGTGKTPLAAWLLMWARRRGLKAAVLTRGYGGKTGRHPVLVSPDTPPWICGDEPLMLAAAYPEAAVLAFPRRVKSARLAEVELAPDLFILDDGMQHLALARESNLVLLRPIDLEEEWNRVIPAGSWREGASALVSASAFFLKADEETWFSLAQRAEQRLSVFGKPVFSFRLAPCGLRPLFARSEGERVLPELYQGAPYILVSGVGQPSGVEQTARLLFGRPPVQHVAFADHHPYTVQDVQEVVKLSAASLPVVCTPKDAVKLRIYADVWFNTPVWILESELVFGGTLFSDMSFPQWWDRCWREMTSAEDEDTAIQRRK